MFSHGVECIVVNTDDAKQWDALESNNRLAGLNPTKILPAITLLHHLRCACLMMRLYACPCLQTRASWP